MRKIFEILWKKNKKNYEKNGKILVNFLTVKAIEGVRVSPLNITIAKVNKETIAGEVVHTKLLNALKY